MLEKRKKNYKENKERITKYNREYYDKNSKRLAEYGKEYRKRNPEKWYLYERERILKKTYNITLKQYNEMLTAQNGVCGICKNPPLTAGKSGKVKPLVVDHCHTSHKIRQLLCDLCNKGLGQFKDNTDYLSNAIEYLNNFKKAV